VVSAGVGVELGRWTTSLADSEPWALGGFTVRLADVRLETFAHRGRSGGWLAGFFLTFFTGFVTGFLAAAFLPSPFSWPWHEYRGSEKWLTFPAHSRRREIRR